MKPPQRIECRPHLPVIPKLPSHASGSMSGLLAAALSDARTLNPKTYRPNAVAWHSPADDGNCHVCLAGSLIARTLSLSPSNYFSPYDFGGEIADKLQALNLMREGIWTCAYFRFHGRWPAAAVYRQLEALPRADHRDFLGWPQFLKHLDSLDSILPRLREIEQTDSAS